MWNKINKFHIRGIQKNGTDELICKAETETDENQLTDTKAESGGDELGNWD